MPAGESLDTTWNDLKAVWSRGDHRLPPPAAQETGTNDDPIPAVFRASNGGHGAEALPDCLGR